MQSECAYFYNIFLHKPPKSIADMTIQMSLLWFSSTPAVKSEKLSPAPPYPKVKMMNKLVLEWQKKHLHHSKIRYVSFIHTISERAEFGRQNRLLFTTYLDIILLNIVSLFLPIL